MASAYPASLPILGTGGKYLTQQLKIVSNGKIKIKFFGPNKLVPPLEIFEAVGTGGIDAGWSASGMWIGKMPAATLFSAIPFGPDISEYLGWIYQGGGLKLWRELYSRHQVVPIPCTILPPEASGWFKKPINSIDDFKGMKIRFYGIGGKVMQKLGASVQLLAGGDIYPALDRGVLDATEFSMPSLDEKLGFHQVAKHYYFPGWHQQTSIIELIINKKKWQSLNKNQQQTIESVCKDVMIRTMTEGESMQSASIDRLKNKGVIIHQWSNEILQRLYKETQVVLKEEAQNDPFFAKVLKSFNDYRKQFKKWRDLSQINLSIEK